jgi:phosphate transport system protein
VVAPVRQEFHRQLDEIRRKVLVLFALVREGVPLATDALLSGDRHSAERLVAADQRMDELDLEIEGLVERLLLTQSPMASEYHFLVTALRIVPELERCGDLVCHIASRAARGVGGEFPPVIRGTVQHLSDEVGHLWQLAVDAFDRTDGEAHEELIRRDTAVDDLARRLWNDTVEAGLPAPITMELALIARFYERLGDHACHITARLRR